MNERKKYNSWKGIIESVGSGGSVSSDNYGSGIYGSTSSEGYNYSSSNY